MEIETGERIHFFCISFSNILEAVGKAQTTHAYTHTHTHTHTHTCSEWAWKIMYIINSQSRRVTVWIDKKERKKELFFFIDWLLSFSNSFFKVQYLKLMTYSSYLQYIFFTFLIFIILFQSHQCFIWGKLS